MFKKNDYFIISYYYYVIIKDSEELRKKQLVYCKKLNLMGRIIISPEGINGTLSGLKNNILSYMENLKNIEEFKNIDFKIIEYNKNVFPKISVKHRNEIVSLKLKKDFFPGNKGEYFLEPYQFYQLLINPKNVFLLDVRNDYEYNLGHFQNAINPNIKNFRDLPYWIEKNFFSFKNKKVCLYCTGGVRCEKISLLLKEKGVNEVYQLKGGIIRYSQDTKTQGKFFQGKMYVFDQRISMKVNLKEKIIVGKDYFDNKPCERYINCANPECNKQILCSKHNEVKYLSSCSDKCRNNTKNRYFKSE
ncbi:rhodanese-like domain protein [Candidatus Phytoplasma oryzae]|uniref:tRNA uridine(34) hydroxylase n=1 Tax=Candidatus Phytoplasma oryzae TaxID=203274 RepID=A0A139JQM5_9MOLU|nr:rhodanese-related sulfurtransferase [Candidatus Phytoplasma oryzae]KXT29272.1 rhodanese-like domain protein [Candidatus Phytoplasma oryzae]